MCIFGKNCCNFYCNIWSHCQPSTFSIFLLPHGAKITFSRRQLQLVKKQLLLVTNSVTSKKFPNVCKSCPKMISLEKLKILTHLQKLPKNVGDLGKLIVAKDFQKLPKSNKLPNLVTLLTKVFSQTKNIIFQ